MGAGIGRHRRQRNQLYPCASTATSIATHKIATAAPTHPHFVHRPYYPLHILIATAAACMLFLLKCLISVFKILLLVEEGRRRWLRKDGSKSGGGVPLLRCLLSQCTFHRCVLSCLRCISRHHLLLLRLMRYFRLLLWSGILPSTPRSPIAPFPYSSSSLSPPTRIYLWSGVEPQGEV